jgi:restriction endonuclease S subunit
LYWVNLATYQDTSPYLSLAIFVTHYTLIPSNPEEPTVPSFQEQTKISNFLTSIDEKITEAQTYLDTVKQYK